MIPPYENPTPAQQVERLKLEIEILERKYDGPVATAVIEQKKALIEKFLQDQPEHSA